MSISRRGRILLSGAVALALLCVSVDLQQPALPSGEVVMSTDKGYYCQGELVNITATGQAQVGSIGDFPHIFWAVTNELGEPVFETINLLLAVGGFNGTLNGVWNQTYRHYGGQPPSGEQVPPGAYTIWFYSIPGPGGSVPDWIPAEIEIGVCSAGPAADAGPDQTVYEGDTVQFNGTGSSGSSSQMWEDAFADDSKISEMHNVTVSGGSATLDPLTLSIEHTFDTDPGFVIEDDMPINHIWWNASRKAIQWYTDREDLFDHYEKLVGFPPFPITDSMDFSAQVDYMYWRADTYAIGDPLLLQKKESWRLGQKHGPTNNTLLVRVYGGDPDFGDLDRLANFMIDDAGGAHIVYMTEHDKHYSELFTSRVTWDSETRTMSAHVRDDSGNIVTNGSKVLDEGFVFSKYGIGSYGEGEIDNKPHIGEGLADNISIKAFGYKTPGWVVSELISPEGLLSWGVLDVEATEPERTQIEIQVLDESGSSILQNIRPDDCPLSLDGLIDPLLFPGIKLRAVLTTERNETPSLPSWNVRYQTESVLDFEWDINHLVDSDSDGNFTNDEDATGPIPTHIYGDDGLYVVTLTVRDESGPGDWDICNITVLNIAPSVEGAQYNNNASFAFRIAGEKWHNVEIYLYEDGTEVGYASITRYPGSPNEQMADLGQFSIDLSKTYSAIAYYTPEDDPINGQIWGATPAWVILEYEDGEERIHHTFNVRHEDTWTWVIDDFSPYFLGHNITFVATASDPGSDDLTFTWDWGDGNTTENTYYNDGVGPDPYPSPEVNPITVTDTVRHGYASAGTYVITLTVTDDDGGVQTIVLLLAI